MGMELRLLKAENKGILVDGTPEIEEPGEKSGNPLLPKTPESLAVLAVIAQYIAWALFSISKCNLLVDGFYRGFNLIPVRHIEVADRQSPLVEEPFERQGLDDARCDRRNSNNSGDKVAT